MQLWIIEFELVLDFYLQFVVVFRCQGQCVHHLKWICGQINLNVSLDTLIYLLSFFHFKNILLTMRFIAQWFFSPFIFWHSLYDDDLHFHFLHTHMNSSWHLAFVSHFSRARGTSLLIIYSSKIIVFKFLWDEKNV